MSEFKSLPDEELNSLLSKGNNFAFQELFNRYWEKLYIAAYKVLGDEVICEDIVQEIFLDLLVRSSSIEIKNIRAYLYQAVRFQITNHIKKIKFIDRRAEIIESHFIGNNVEDYISTVETQSLIKESISSMPNRSREVFYLSRYENLSNKEIATKLGISVFTVETHMKKSLKYLRKSLDIAIVIIIMEQFLN
ncbi:RNA polymerase sigma-70 factor [Chondrinema litorale]|uniref:RNA polymerase sigma-70 factor n=1 Tax=Chondrinema litorale TaxID=2994555 RepID=UPI0025435569|nr:RNA polymerase sigma-70 factor [Chondrinema litorale]UZR98399.1 RNA polymerase sigma-70 factor [Chondrinema litorale]